MPKQIPHFETDEELEAFLEGDLSDLDFSQFTRVHFEGLQKSEEFTVLLRTSLVEAVQRYAAARGISDEQYVIEAIEQALLRDEPEKDEG